MSLFSNTKTNVPFVNGFEDVAIPAGKRVVSATIVNDDGREYVQISVEDVPVNPPEVLATITVSR